MGSDNCTPTVAGNRWFNVERYGIEAKIRWKKRFEAYDFFMTFINADCDHIAVENPVGYVSHHYRLADQIIHPYYFYDGNPENWVTKRTALWLKGLPKLKRTYTGPEYEFTEKWSNGKTRIGRRSTQTLSCVVKLLSVSQMLLPNNGEITLMNKINEFLLSMALWLLTLVVVATMIIIGINIAY